MIEYCIHPDLKFILLQTLHRKGVSRFSETTTYLPESQVFYVYDKEWSGYETHRKELEKSYPTLAFHFVYCFQKPEVKTYAHYPRVDSMLAFLCEWASIAVHKTWVRMFPTYAESDLQKYVQVFWKAQFLPSEVRGSFVTKELKQLSESTFSLYLSLDTWDTFIQKVIDLKKAYPDAILQYFVLNVLQKILDFKISKRLPTNPQMAEAIQKFALTVSKKDLFTSIFSLYTVETDLLLRLTPLRSLLWALHETGD